MSATVLIEPPISGSLPEHRFNAVGDCTWIAFCPPAEDSWVGVFGNGDWGGRSVAVSWDHGRAVVIARGVIYVVDTSGKTLIAVLRSVDLASEVVFCAAHSVFVVADSLSLHVLGLDGELRCSSGRISWDGIRRLRVMDDGRVAGESWDLSRWVEFTLDLENRQFEGWIHSGPDITGTMHRWTDYESE